MSVRRILGPVCLIVALVAPATMSYLALVSGDESAGEVEFINKIRSRSVSRATLSEVDYHKATSTAMSMSAAVVPFPRIVQVVHQVAHRFVTQDPIATPLRRPPKV